MSIDSQKRKPSTSISFLEVLRSQTSEAHKKLESLPLSKSIINPQITLEQYALYLSLMHDVVENLEQNIYPILSDVISDLENRKKAIWIENDLKSIGKEKKAINFSFENTSAISVPFAMGIMYVLEGSTLGGRFILKNIQENLGLTPENGASYFDGYGNKTGSTWKKFLSEMTDFENKTNSQDEIIKGAEYGFTVMEQHLSTNSF
ncbi:biliverdin-producing heme oxygenase [Flavobacterium agrisoli]|uniref:Biliverdin-producing heme oxygenase n=1 Tax=Flavobacterium agrisoli TaxID=2793066 RepID=A0A934PLY3_9FLAO|nr:biliverdin-producing heme oxygenase [Flavobacterium agrisoli]MBK0368901.1 biliverdin-producing heme oxygenase [Flavobacterium agrisoli]